jgi:hypothetical protein
VAVWTDETGSGKALDLKPRIELLKTRYVEANLGRLAVAG